MELYYCFSSYFPRKIFQEDERVRNFPFLFLNIDTGDSETENTREKQKTELL